VFAGTINGNGILEIRTTKPAGESTLAHIIKLIGSAQAKRAPSEKWVEKFAQIYTPTVLVLAILLAIVPPLFVGEWFQWFYRALVLLVIACPCALVISTPVTIVAALASAARQGVLIKGGLHVETPAHVKVFALDKTGTLTEGKPRVLEVFPLNGHSETELLERAASLESHSDHPLALAILAHAKEKGIAVPAADEFRIIPGKGAAGKFQGREFWLGSHRHLEEKKMETPEVHEQLVNLSDAGRSVIVVGNDQHVCGVITVADAVRADAAKVITQLHKLGVEKVIMLSGDNAGTANAIGKEVGVDEVRAELLPADKVTAIEELVKQHGTVAMVGDGVNDAPALASASLGLAMGAIGTDAAIETADIALMSDDLSRLPWLIQHSRRTLSVIRQNIAFSLIVKALFVGLTFTGHASMWAAIAADMGASLLVIFNGLRLLRSGVNEPDSKGTAR
jgi:Cd2+/Zn2+-exporting ATPase